MDSHSQIKVLLVVVVVVGLCVLSVGIYTIVNKSDPPTTSAASTNQNLTPSEAVRSLTPKKTMPQGPVLGNETTGLYYRNTTNSLESGVAYKFTTGETVYVYDGAKMRPVTSPAAFFNFYGCSGNRRVIDCAPVYEMPRSVTAGMLNGQPLQ